MSERILENNKVNVIGRVAEDFTFSHEVFGEGFYLTTLRVDRLSGLADEIPLMVSERLLDMQRDHRNEELEVSGQFRSFNRREGNRSRLILSVFAREVRSMEDGEEAAAETPDPSRINQIYLDGYLCRKPVYRKTPMGREIADLLLAVNRSYGKSDYIPCIAWGRNARFAANLRTGNRLRIWGRVQSRAYTKKIDEGNTEMRTAYEATVNKLEYVDPAGRPDEAAGTEPEEML